MKLLESWKRNIERAIFFLVRFLVLKVVIPANENGAHKKLFINHLGAFQKPFSLYNKDVDISKFEWVTNPFAVSGLTTCERHQHVTHIL
jgi:hypothetical protein